jgi:uncharacterized protein
VSFDWDEANTKHIARHGVLPAEVEQCFEGGLFFVGGYVRSGEYRETYLAATPAGRILKITVTERRGSIRPVMAYDATTRSAMPKAFKKVWEELGLYRKRDNTVGIRNLPDFATEAEEAAWLDRIGPAISAYVVEHQLGRRGPGPMLRRLLNAPAEKKRERARPISIRLSEDDIALAKRQAAQEGIPYQTYLKGILSKGLRKAG